MINGQKLLITNGTWVDVALVFARTSDEGARGITAFLVPTDTAGIEARESTGTLGRAARLLVWRCADLVDRGEPFRIAASNACARPSCSPRRQRCERPTTPSRCTAGRGTSMTTRPRSTSVTLG